ncbi:enoyl-CoA hydratase/isomerase [Cucurbitaria berberidis CBS 394.84]|uniref:Enoyl-CoA hydratase/isomerase n=1 Tax=Cucurbitaria berberidis CBS 394.84 TaxID=1168544 RepID=A0A9P4GGS2_9PLEO|nr:enoyl-CoA hydratase/isomerase [Cucurbitaria berberidis CBS 394.84]KAF1844961.1 enoyl-CoA hydratase/isomerase [Cucurbitaria berberidis CBS 394.84]
MANLETQPPPTKFLQLSYPVPRVVLATMSRPKDLNCMNTSAHWEMDAFWKWLDLEPSLTVAIITGSGRAFSAGADLKEWDNSMAADADPKNRLGNAPAFKPLSRRLGKKPVIAAVNGLSMGAGTEFAINCDLVVAAENAYFALPEVKRGVSPIGGALPRIIRTLGLQRASEFALTGRNVSAKELHSWGLVNSVVPLEGLIAEAVRYATMIAENSPDAIICTRAGLREGWESASVERAVEITLEREFAQLQRGENILEGLKAFTEKRRPVWKASKL